MDSMNLQKLIVNKSALKIYNDKQFWIDLFNYHNIPILVANFDEYERYEKCYSIVKNILLLSELESRKDKYSRQLIALEFENENIMPYLPPNLINEIKEYIIENEIEDVPLEILKQLNMPIAGLDIEYKQSIYFTFYNDYNQYNPSISYTLDTDDVLIEVNASCNIQEYMTKLLYVFPDINITDGDFTYLPKILCDFYNQDLSLLREVIQFRCKFWQRKQWYL